MSLPYRKDIDGLRAIAVLGVLFYHLDHRICPGGFTGVDIFFVISGYLITSILYAEITNGTFSLSRFYERRIRRILPAYFFLLFITTILGFLLLTPEALEQYAKAMSHSLVFVSNFLFAQNVDYFAKSFTSSPLLHTWSLAVEEQFYLLWPVILWLCRNIFLQKKLIFILLVSLGASFLTSEILTIYQPKLSFFMIYSRAWELGMGAIIALPFIPKLGSLKLLEFLSFFGLLLICISLLFVNQNLRFPGFSAMYAVLGSTLIIYTGKYGSSTIHKILSNSTMVSIGLISYSLYLWHWPLITLSKYYLSRDLTLSEIIGVALISFLCSYFSYRFIEKPFRNKTTSVTKPSRPFVRKIFLTPLLLTIIFLAFSILLDNSGGLPLRYSKLHQPLLYSSNPFREACHISRPETTLPESDKCTYSFGNKKALLWGDSHADHYMPALKELANNGKISLRQISKSACVPMVGDFDIFRLSRTGYTQYDECKIINNKILQTIDDQDIEIVFLAGRWSNFLGNDSKKKPAQYLRVHGKKKPATITSEEIFTSSFRNTISILRNKGVEVILLGEVPFFRQNPPECFLKQVTPLRQFFEKDITFNSDVCSVPRDSYVKSLDISRNFFTTLYRNREIRFFDPFPYICDNSSCTALKNNTILYHDTHHLNLEGAKYLQPFISEFIQSNTINRVKTSTN